MIIGGHLDSVPNGGWLDGALGVHGGSRRAADVQRTAARRSRSPSSIGPTRKARASAAACSGPPPPSGSLDVDDVRGAHRQAGHAARRCAARERRRRSIGMLDAHAALKKIRARAYLELHIEQGPVLESMNKPTGVVLGHLRRRAAHAALRRAGRAFRLDADPDAPRRVPRRRGDRARVPRDRAALHDTRRARCLHGRHREGRARHRHRRAGRLRDLARSARARRRRARRGCSPTRRRRRSRPPREQRHGRVAHALADRAASVRSAADRTVRRGRPRGHRRRAAAAVRPAARRRRDGAAHAGRDDVRLFVQRPVALQRRRHAGADLLQTIEAFLRLVDKTVRHDRCTREWHSLRRQARSVRHCRASAPAAWGRSTVPAIPDCPYRRDQGAAPGAQQRPHAPPAIRAGGQDDFLPRPSSHLRTLRYRDRGRARLHRDALPSRAPRSPRGSSAACCRWQRR